MKPHKNCSREGLAIRDTLDIVGGKWKLPILYALRVSGPLRFKELQREVSGITSRMLSKELKELEINQMVKREVFDTSPVSVVYELTEHGDSLCPVIEALCNWGLQHRRRIFELAEQN